MASFCQICERDLDTTDEDNVCPECVARTRRCLEAAISVIKWAEDLRRAKGQVCPLPDPGCGCPLCLLATVVTKKPERAAAPPRVQTAELIEEVPQHVLRVLDVRQRAAENARGRVPKKGDVVQRRRDPRQVVDEVGESWVFFEPRPGDPPGFRPGATRELIASEFEYL